MNSYCKTFLMVVAVTLTLMLCLPAFAQGPAELSTATPATTAEASAGPNAPTPQKASTAAPDEDNGWHFIIAPYLWFPGISGTVGALGHDASVHASASDVLSYFNFGLMGAVEARKDRFVFPVDFMWVRLTDDKGLPDTDLGQTSVRLYITETILTPKFGYRVVDYDRFKVDALVGIRYWHLGQNFTLHPSGFYQSQSADWVDGLFGSKIELAFSPKVGLTVFGDVGGGASALDYQAGGVLGYKIKPTIALQLGWRYLYDRYHGDHQFIWDVHESGPMLGATFEFPTKPPIPPSASCSAQPTEVWSGDPVNVTATGANFNPKHTVTYNWTPNGGKLSSTNAETATVDTAGMTPGSYSAVATVTDPKEKKNNSATCTANFTIKQPQPPQVSCLASPTTIAIGEPATITMTATDPQGWPMTYSWSATGGQLSGSGTTATVTATNADAGNTITVTGTASDARANLSSSCTASVNVPAVQKCAVIEDWGECTFEKNPKKPWRVDNDCKDTLDKLALRLQQMPNGKLDVVGYTNQEESVNVQQLGSQRSVNVKYYLTTDGPTKVDASRVQPRQGAVKGQATHFYFVPEGNMCGGQLEEGTVVDETQVQPQSRNAPAPKHKAKKAAPAAGN
jgi:hypothetical protein